MEGPLNCFSESALLVFFTNFDLYVLNIAISSNAEMCARMAPYIDAAFDHRSSISPCRSSSMSSCSSLPAPLPTLVLGGAPVTSSPYNELAFAPTFAEWPERLRGLPDTRPWPEAFDNWSLDELRAELRDRFQLNPAQLSVPKGTLVTRYLNLLVE